MHKIVLVAAMALICEAGYAQALTSIQLAQATSAPEAAAPAATVPAAQPAPAAPAPQAAPTAQAAPDASPRPTAKPTKPAKKRAVRRRETDEEKARRIAAKYGVSW
jgi:hypothetical protein